MLTILELLLNAVLRPEPSGLEGYVPDLVTQGTIHEMSATLDAEATVELAEVAPPHRSRHHLVIDMSLLAAITETNAVRCLDHGLASVTMSLMTETAKGTVGLEGEMGMTANDRLRIVE